MSDQKISLTIKHLSHDTYKVEIENDKTVLELKQKIEEQSKINTAEIKLIFKGKILKKDDEKLSDLNITDGCALHMVHNKPKQESENNTLPNQQQQNQNSQQQQQVPPNPFMNMGMGMPNMGQGMGMGMPGMGMGQGMGGMGMPGMGQMDMAQAQQMLQNPQMRAMAQNLLSNPEMLRNMIQNNPMLQQMAQNNPQLSAMLENPEQMRNLSNMMFGSTPQQQTQPGQEQGQQQQQQGMPQFPMFNPGMFQNMQMPTNMGQQQPQGEQNYEELYKEQLKKLEEMGFTNKQVNIDVLKQCYGNVDLAIERLLGVYVFTILTIISSSFQVPLTQSIVLANNQQSQVNDYSKCFELVEKLGVDVAEIIADITTKNIPAIIVKAVETVKLTYEAIKCFENNFSQNDLMKILDGDKRQCYMDHLSNALSKIVDFTQDLGNGDTDQAVEDFKQLVDILRDAQKNCQIILQQQLLTCLTMQKKLKTGNVKMINRETLAVTVLGPKNDKGYFREKKLDLHCVSFFNETKEQAFNRMRELLVGQKVQFDDYKLQGGKTAADIFVDKKLVSYIMVSEGLACVSKEETKPSKYMSDLTEGQAQAKQNNKGYYNDQLKKKKKKQKKLDSFQGKVLCGYIEEFNFELDFQFYSEETGLVKQFKFAGIKIPIVSKEHAVNLKNFLSKNACQREARLLIKDVISENEVLVFDQSINEKSSVLHQLLVKGWAKLDNNAAEELDNMELLCYKALQEQAMNKKKRIWENYEGPKTQTTVIKEPEFEGVINEVISGDFFVVKSLKTKESYRVNLSNIKAPKCTTTKQDGEKWGDEAKEFMRKNFIGKKVYVKIDQVRNIKKDEDEFTITSATISYQKQSIGIQLLEKGLAEFRTPRNNEQSSLAIKEYALATQNAQDNKKGIFSNKDPVQRQYFDVTKQENKKKFKADFMLSEYKGYEEGVIDYVFSGSRYKIRFDKPKIYFMFTLNSVKTLTKNAHNDSHQEWADKATNFAKKNLMQRTVKFQIESVDKFGNGHGTLTVNGKNFAYPILQKGYGYLEKSYKPSENYQKYLQLQEEAKKQKNGIWGVKDIQEELNGQQQEDQLQEVEQQEKKVQISECPDFDHVHLQEYGSKLNELTKKIKEKAKDQNQVKEPLQKKTIVLGLFEKEYYRCKILNKSKDKYDVLFIDYGNRDKLSLNQMKVCPKDLQKIKPLSFQAVLDYIKLPPQQHVLGQEAFGMFMDMVYDKKLVAVINSKYKGIRRVMLYQQDQLDEKDSINFKLMESGLALLDEHSRKGKDENWIESNEKGLDKNPDLLNVITEQEEY